MAGTLKVSNMICVMRSRLAIGLRGASVSKIGCSSRATRSSLTTRPVNRKSDEMPKADLAVPYAALRFANTKAEVMPMKPIHAWLGQPRHAGLADRTT